MGNIIAIKDFAASELDLYARTTENQLLHYYEPNGGLFLAESPKVVERALSLGCEPISFLVEKKHLETQAKYLIDRYDDIPVYTAEFDVLTKLTGFALTRGMLCVLKRPEPISYFDAIKDKKRIAVLENVMNPTNMGAIFRSAAALNMEAVLLTPGCTDPYYRRASRVSMGTVFQVPWAYIAGDYIAKLQELGFKTAAMALKEDSVSIDEPNLMQEEKLAVILGTEGDGLAEDTIRRSDYTVMIPMSHGVDSLNVAAASAVAFWQLGRK